MELAVFNLGPLGTNSYLLHNGKEAVMFDVGGEPSEVLKYLKEKGLTLKEILVTHMHFDHVLGVTALAESTGAEVWANSRDSYLLGNLGDGWPVIPRDFKFSELDEGEKNVLNVKCQVLSTPGHTPGSLSYYFQDFGTVFVGDVLFYRSVGRTDFPGGNTETLMNSIRQKLYTLPGQTAVYPGHNLETNIADEKRLNSLVQA